MPLTNLKSIRFWHSDMHLNLSVLRAFIASLERQIEAEINNYPTSVITDVFGNVAPELAEEITHKDGIDDRTFDLNSVFLTHIPNLHRRSAFLTVFSFFEESVVALAERYQEESQTNITLNDLAGKGLHRAHNYMTKVIGLDLSLANTEWNRITKYQKIRNYITHNNGVLEPEQSHYRELTNFISHTSGIDLVNGVIEIHKDFLMRVLLDAEIYINQINKALRSGSNS